MSLLHLFEHRTRRLQLLALLLFLLILNLSHFVAQRYAMQQQAIQLVQLVQPQTALPQGQPFWLTLTAENGLVTQAEPAKTDYIALNIGDVFAFVDKRLLPGRSFWFYFALNTVFILLFLPLILLFRRRRSALTST